MSVEKIPGENAGDNESEEVSVELLAKVENMKKGDIIILNTGERITITGLINIDGVHGWKCTVEYRKSGAIIKEYPFTPQTIKDYIRNKRVEKIVLISNGEVAEDNREVHKADVL